MIADGAELDAQVRAAAAPRGGERTRAAAARAARTAAPLRALRADAVHRRHRLPEPSRTLLQANCESQHTQPHGHSEDSEPVDSRHVSAHVL